MRGLFAFLFLAAAVAAAPPDLPLGPYARPGTPVLLRSDGAREVSLDGWRFQLRTGVTWVHPPRVPCVVRDAAGQELVTLAVVPEGMRFVGVVGAVPPDLPRGVHAVRIWPEGMRF